MDIYQKSLQKLNFLVLEIDNLFKSNFWTFESPAMWFCVVKQWYQWLYDVAQKFITRTTNNDTKSKICKQCSFNVVVEVVVVVVVEVIVVYRLETRVERETESHRDRKFARSSVLSHCSFYRLHRIRKTFY